MGPHSTLEPSAEAAFVLVAVGCAVGLGGWLALRVRRSLVAARLRRRTRHAADGERRAANLLAAAGYEIVHVQPRTAYTLDVDGRPSRFEVRADFVVQRRGERFVAEVKTGSLAPSLELPATRRQLLEYARAFDVARVLLVDVDAAVLQVVTVGAGRPARVRFLALAFTAAAALGTLLSLLR